MSLPRFLRGETPRPNPAPRPRSYAQPVAKPDDAGGTFWARYTRGIDAVLAAMRPADFDWRVVQKWQYYPAQVTDAERDELRRMGAWFRRHGRFREPEVLYRAVRVPEFAPRWESAPDAEVAAYGLGLRSWAQGPNVEECFCGEAHCLRFEWVEPPAAAIVLDGAAVREWLEEERPDLHEALEAVGDGTVGFDGDEYICEPRALVVEWRDEARPYGRGRRLQAGVRVTRAARRTG